MKKRPDPVQSPLHRSGSDRTGHFSEPGMDDRGYPECADGTSKPCGGPAPFECDRGRDQEIHQQSGCQRRYRNRNH